MYYSNFLTESFLVDVTVTISVVCNFSLSRLPVLHVLFALLGVYVAVQLTVPTGQFQKMKTTDNFVWEYGDDSCCSRNEWVNTSWLAKNEYIHVPRSS